jgi:hypothetical protein
LGRLFFLIFKQGQREAGGVTMHIAEHLVLAYLAAHCTAYFVRSADCGSRYRYIQIPLKTNKKNNLILKTPAWLYLHSFMNNRRTLSQDKWNTPNPELSHHNSHFKIIADFWRRIPCHLHYIHIHQYFLQLPKMEKKI